MPPRANNKKQLPPTVFNENTCAVRGFTQVPTHEPTYFHPNPEDEMHDMYYEVHGTGTEHLLFIMGMKNCCFSWQRQVDCFGSDPRYSVLVLDNRGSGSSDTPRGPYSTALMARDCLTIMDSLGWDMERGVHVVGVSMGGMIALQLASMASFRIASLTLAVTTAGHGVRRMFPPAEGLQISTRNLLQDQMERYMLMLYPEAWLDEIDPHDPEGRTNRETRISEHLERTAMIPGQSALANFYQLSATTTHHVPSEDLNRINDSIPKICVLSAKNDSLIPPDASDNLCKHMKDAELVVWDDAGHAIHSQHPQRFNQLIERVVTEGRDAAGPPRKQRPDSLFLYPREKQSPASFYPKSLSELVDKLWITSRSKDGADEDDQDIVVSPVGIKDESGTQASSGVVGFDVSERNPSQDSQPQASPLTTHAHAFRELVERVMKDPLARNEASGVKPGSADDGSRPHSNLADLVTRVRAVVRRKSDYASSATSTRPLNTSSSPPPSATRPSSPTQPIPVPLPPAFSEVSRTSTLPPEPYPSSSSSPIEANETLAPPLPILSSRAQTLPLAMSSDLPRHDYTTTSNVAPSPSLPISESPSRATSRTPRILTNILTSPKPRTPFLSPVSTTSPIDSTTSTAPTSPLALFTRPFAGRSKSSSRIGGSLGAG